MSSTSTTASVETNKSNSSEQRYSPTCTVCNSEPSKYTCPRCQIKTCSLACSRTHKTTMGCSGERDRTGYVPMNQYGYSALMNDYVFLEEIGRKVENWGREIVQSGLALNGVNAREGRGRGATRMRTPRRKTDRKSILAMQLNVRDVDMDTLPAGMKRASMNSSYWDMKGKRALLSIEFVFEPPPNPLTRHELKPVSMITHKKDWQQTIRQILRATIREAKKAREYKALLDWLDLEEEDESISSSVLCLMKKLRSYDDPVELKPNRPSYYKLDWNEPLSKVLRRKHFVEFPTIFMTDESSFDGVLVEDGVIEEDMRDRRAKRRKLDSGESKKILSSLVGGYGSEEDQEQEGQNALESLADYPEDGSEDGPEVVEDVASEDDEVINIQDPLNLEVDLMDGGDDEEEDLDWGDDEIADEAKLAELSAAIRQRLASR